MSDSNKRREMDLRQLMMNDHKVEMKNDDVKEFYVEFHGPKDSPYSGGVWKIKVGLPNDYPYQSPSITFVNKIYHPNINETSGAICLNLLNKSWSPMFDLVNIFELFLPQLLMYPNPSHGMNREASVLMMRDKTLYEETAKVYTERYAKPEDEGAASEDKCSDDELTEADSDSNSADEAVAVDP